MDIHTIISIAVIESE